jgi:hypothetical protein
VTKIKRKTCKITKTKLPISKNQSKARFKLINQSNTDIRSSSQAIEAKLGEKIIISSLQQFLQESSQVIVEHSMMI